jgi:hypothetical protein
LRAGGITNRSAGGYSPAISRGEPTKDYCPWLAPGGETALTVHWLGPSCYHQAVKTFEELKLWNDMIFVDIPKHRRLVCSKCGGGNVKVMPIFLAARGTRAYGS